MILFTNHKISFVMMLMLDCEVTINVDSDLQLSFFPSELSAAGAKREKFTHQNCNLSTIHLGPAGRRPAWA